MKTVTIADAQAELPKLIGEAEPLVLTDASRPVAVLIQITPQIACAAADWQLTVVPLHEFLSSGNTVKPSRDDLAYVIVSHEARSPTGTGRDWWAALQAIVADQQQRGFVGTVSEIDRDDEGYDQRMNEIEKHTVSRN